MFRRSPLRPLLAAAALVLFGAPVLAGSDKPRLVVELFTSQGCASCPPADKLLGDLATDPSVLAVSMPVDYWDYLGWKDTLADRAFTDRQKAYSEVRGDRQIYTPQAVVDGFVHAVGSNQDAILSAEKSAGSHGALTIPITVQLTASSIKVDVPARQGSEPATVLLVPIVRKMDVAIARGENKGRTITYNNVARTVVPLGIWKGDARSFEVPLASLAKASGCDSYAVLLQSGTPARPGVILGAAKVSRGPGSSGL